MNKSTTCSSSLLSLQVKLIQKLGIVRIQGRDRRGHPILLIIAKLFPAKIVSVKAVKKYLEEEIFPCLEGKPFSVVYVHTCANRAHNFPGISALKSIHDFIPLSLKQYLQAFYFVHPGLRSRLFLATFGRLLFTGATALYWKVRYVNRLEFLWNKVWRNEIEIPDFAYEFDKGLEYRPTVDYGVESDHPRILYGATSFDCISMSSIA